MQRQDSDWPGVEACTPLAVIDHWRHPRQVGRRDHGGPRCCAQVKTPDLAHSRQKDLCLQPADLPALLCLSAAMAHAIEAPETTSKAAADLVLRPGPSA